MNVELTPDERAFVQRAIESGRFSREEEAIEEALALWEERERRRLEILAMLDEADASLARGEGREITEESMKALAEEVKARGRRRLAAERANGISRRWSENSPRCSWRQDDAADSRTVLSKPARVSSKASTTLRMFALISYSQRQRFKFGLRPRSIIGV